MSEALRYLCICADDFGMSAGINSAVFDLAEQGKISAASCMVRRDAWLTGTRMLRRIDPARFDAGLHLDSRGPRVPVAPSPGSWGCSHGRTRARCSHRGCRPTSATS